MKWLSPDILVVGAGVSGCAAAVALARQGLDVLLIEKDLNPRPVLRGEYLQPGAIEILCGLGFSEQFYASPSTSRVSKLRFSDLDKNGRREAGIELKYPNGLTALAVSSAELMLRLYKVCDSVLGNRFWRGAELKPFSDDPNFLSKPAFICRNQDGQEYRIEPKRVIGCDGRHSNIRKWIQGGKPSRNGSVAAGAPCELIAGATMSGHCSVTGQYEVVRTRHHGTAMGFSIGDHGKRIYVGVKETSKLKLAQNLQNCLRLAHSYLGDHLSDDEARVSGYPANTEWFGPSSSGAFYLVGDALAVSSPYGGQGMTTAMEHVQFLSESLGENVEQDLAQSYESFTKKLFKRVSLLNFGIYHVFFSRNPLLRPLGRQVLKNWQRNPEIPERVMRLFGGIDRDVPSLSELLGIRKFPFILPQSHQRKSLSVRRVDHVEKPWMTSAGHGRIFPSQLG